MRSYDPENTMKKSIFVIAAVCLLTLLLALTAAAETVGEGECGDGVTWTLDEKGVLTVGGSGAMTDYFADGELTSPFAALRGRITAVEIREGITAVGDNAFSGCGGVKSVSFPEGLTRVGEGAFYSCAAVKEIALPDGLTFIGRQAFRGCTALEAISLPDSVERIGEKAFADTAWYNALPDGIVYLDHALLAYKGEMSRKTEATVEEGTLLIADSAFWACGRMKSLSLPDGLKYIGEAAFWKCDGVSEIKLPKGLLTIGDEAFYCCHFPEKTELPRSLTAIGKSAFSGCTGLQRVFVAADVKEIGPQAFPEKTVIVGYEGTFAQSYAEQMGLQFKVRVDEYAPETTTAPEGERVKLQRRKETGTVVACAAAGVIGMMAVIGLVALRIQPKDDAPQEEPMDGIPMEQPPAENGPAEEGAAEGESAEGEPVKSESVEGESAEGGPSEDDSPEHAPTEDGSPEEDRPAGDEGHAKAGEDDGSAKKNKTKEKKKRSRYRNEWPVIK